MGGTERRGEHVIAALFVDERGAYRACHVEQGHYGHRARKATWLYAVNLRSYPDLIWGPSEAKAWTSWGDFDKYPDVPRLGKREGDRNTARVP